MSSSVVFSKVGVFPGYGDELLVDRDVVVDGNTIAAIRPHEPDADIGGAKLIAGNGRVLMPGLIDAHAHAAFSTIAAFDALTADVSYLHLVAGSEATRMLLQGFTSLRDCGGPTFGLQRSIDEGVIPGPRIYPSGAMISQTSGHGDFRFRYEVPRDPCCSLSHIEAVGAAAIADGEEQVLRAVREQLMLGATQIKLMAGGGVSSLYDPIDVTQYTEREMRAAVEAAENWGTYVMVHAYTPRAIRQALRAGVRSIEHGHLADQETAEAIAEAGAWWSLQPFLMDEDAIPVPPASQPKQEAVSAGTDQAYTLAKSLGIKVAWGTDTLFDAGLAGKRGKVLAKMTRWYTSAEVLTMATSGNADLLAMCGLRNPYPGVLGRVEVGALADLLLVDGDPIADIGLLADPESNLCVVMKDGVLYKNHVPA